MLLLPITEDNLCVSSNIILFKEPHTNILFFLARNRITANFSILDRCQIPVKFKEKHITWIRVSPINTVVLLNGDIVFDDVAFNPLTPKGFPIDKQTRLALDRVKSISANWH